MLATSEKVQYSVGIVEQTRIHPQTQITKHPISMYMITVLYFMALGNGQMDFRNLNVVCAYLSRLLLHVDTYDRFTRLKT